MKSILIFGGSFDPIHNGHLKLFDFAYKTLKVNKGYSLLAKKARWKDPTVSEKHRLKMLKIALKDYPRYKINLYEFKKKDNDETYTFDTINNLYGKKKNLKIYFMIGSDQLQKLHKWHRVDELSKLVTFVVFRRNGYSVSYENMNKYNCIFLETTAVDISSTDIRKLKNLDLPKSILTYIEKNKLYYYHELYKYISYKRVEHSYSVASLSYDIAKSNGVNPSKAYLAGLIHDIAKGLNEDEELEIMRKDFKEYIDKLGSWSYHQFIATLVAKKEFNIDDEEILHAIKYHATGSSNMTKLDKIIYCADKLDPLRGWNSSSLIKACKKDIDEGFKQVLFDNIRYFETHNKDYRNELTLSCINEYLNERK